VKGHVWALESGVQMNLRIGAIGNSTSNKLSTVEYNSRRVIL